MLPRHLRRSIVNSAVRRSLQHPAHFPPPFRIAQAASASTTSTYIRSFHSSRRRLNEVPKSPFQTFVDVLRDELQKNRKLQEDVKQLQGDVDKLQDSEAMKRARAAYERARVSYISSIARIWSFDGVTLSELVAYVEYKRESEAESCRGGIEEARCEGQ